jgi:catalase
VFDAVAVLLADAAGKKLARESAAVDFVANAWVHLKAIASDAGAAPLLKAGNVGKDPGIVDAADSKGFVSAASTRQWAREPKVRTLA